ncbi:MAG: aminoacyl-tRNA hydrolase [Cycloclasticus sp. symbiont of Poecilosclerida sp. N]|nr:MAG: aminoacyl-tRNA hydrolase [Cycloclasticus sp. symbiont of Poecilosclerida sp. N]
MISLIVGLGNPGDEYKKTRHNAGFLLLDALAKNIGVSFSYNSKFKADIAKGTVEGKPIHLLKPQTYMNNSGLSVCAYAKYFDISAQQIAVVHDELDFEPGDIRLKRGGGHGGHNGLRDIASRLASKEFYRLRVGIGHPGEHANVSDYVLNAPNKADEASIRAAIEAGLAEISYICKGDFQSVMQRLHTG